MTETTESLDTSTGTAGNTDAAAPAKGRTRKGEGLSGMVLTDLKALAGTLGIKGTSGMRKGDLVAAIAARQSGAGASSTATSPVKQTATRATNGRAARTAEPDTASTTTNGHTGDPVLPLGDLAPSTTPAQDSRPEPDRQPASSGEQGGTDTAASGARTARRQPRRR